MSDLPTVRSCLGARQQQVLATLLAGGVPAGFDERTTRSASAQLMDKRRLDALTACPELSSLIGFGLLFDEWSRTSPRVGCAHDDVSAFVDAAVERPEVRWWQAELAVLSGKQSIAWIHRRGRRELMMGIGPWLWRLAWKPETRSEAQG
ncbi:MAG: hypothetical protein M3063_16320 [Actinomycetota bacterium]|nr:hypothetical protein [Actinomycetota bacterium]MDQ6947565.1 hypothetical protein [Actinomycetota bacterium]